MNILYKKRSHDKIYIQVLCLNKVIFNFYLFCLLKSKLVIYESVCPRNGSTKKVSLRKQFISQSRQYSKHYRYYLVKARISNI